MAAGGNDKSEAREGGRPGRRSVVAVGTLITTWVLFEVVTASNCSHGESAWTLGHGIFASIIFAWVAGVTSVWWQAKPGLKKIRVAVALFSFCVWLFIAAIIVNNGNKLTHCRQTFPTLPTDGAPTFP
jgi:hypothetical protein